MLDAQVSFVIENLAYDGPQGELLGEKSHSNVKQAAM